LRKKLLFCFFIITISAGAQTSVYHPFPDSGAVWIMNFNHSCHNSSIGCLFDCNSNYQYRVDGDTLIFGNIYKKIIKDSFLKYCSCIVISPPNPWSTPSCNQYPFDSYFFGGIRNDSANKKVYYIQDGNYPERILYDFNLNVGDSLQNSICNKTILKIDSVFIGSDYRKCYWLDTSINANFYNDRIIEGIGHVGTMFGGPFEGCWPIVADFGWGFSCFIENGNVLYGDSNCALVTSAENISHERSLVILFPNPATNELRIGNSNLKIESIEIYNLIGEKCLTVSAGSTHRPTLSKGEGDSFIDVSMLTPGMYFARVKTEKGISIRKFVKQ
jgi:hypothetical protein